MNPLAAALSDLMALGVTGEALVAAISRMEQAMYIDGPKLVDEAAERRRAKDRERKRQVSQLRRIPQNSAESVDSTETLSRPLSPQTPQTPTHTHGDINTHTRKADVDPDGFAAFWEVYPRRVGRGAAVKSYRSALGRGASPPSLRSAVERDKRSQWAGRSTEMIPHAATWLNQDRWLDEPPEPQEQQTILRSANDRPTRQSVQLTERYENYQRAYAGAEVAAQHRAVEPSSGF